jgi:hypothetical protein
LTDQAQGESEEALADDCLVMSKANAVLSTRMHLTFEFVRIHLNSFESKPSEKLMNQVTTMEPLSARIPSDLYLWLAQLRVEGATTNSDKLRVLLGQLKRQHDGLFDYSAAHAWVRAITATLRESLVSVEGQSGVHSDVMAAVLEHTTATLAMLVSQTPKDLKQAAKLEELLVRRSFALCETLLRQATTATAAAYDPTVVRRQMLGTVEMATKLAPKKGA